MPEEGGDYWKDDKAVKKKNKKDKKRKTEIITSSPKQ